jgi:hypothetical protein
MSTNQEIRARIVGIARSYIGSTAWDDAAENGNFGPNTNKCNLFVYDVLTAAGASPGLPHGHWFWKLYPPAAGDWPNPSYDIPNWRILDSTEKPEPGDIIAQKINYGDASGHVMIVADKNFVIGTGDSATDANGKPLPHGSIEYIPMPPALGPTRLVAGPEVFRRFTGEGAVIRFSPIPRYRR